MARGLLRVLPFVSTIVHASQLPSVHVEEKSSKQLSSAKWWAQVGDRVFYSPPTSLIGLSQNVSDYYYVLGSKKSLGDRMAKNVVGSHGRWHIMHLPKGPSLLELSHRSGDRRGSHSDVKRLKEGMVLGAGFPPYELNTDYLHPLDAKGQALEKAAVAHITPDATMDYLKKLLQFPTRSYSNDDASDKVEHFLQKEFEALGFHSCFHNFDAGGRKLTNVIAHIRGQKPGTVVVGAHYDSRPFDGSAPGAEDNGSGVASMLAMAKAFATSKAKPEKDVFFVAFAGEEPGLIGSAHFANALKSEALPGECFASASSGSDPGETSFIQLSQNRRQRGLAIPKSKGAQLIADAAAPHRPGSVAKGSISAIIMDEVGWASPKLDKQTVNLESYDAISKELMDHLRHSSKMHNGDSINVVHNGSPFGSDHMSFLDNGMPGVLTINGDDEAYPHYHQSDDTIENVNAELMAKTAKMNLGGLFRLSM